MSQRDTTCSPGQMLILIGSDGKRAVVSRAIATEASYVLRDLLDGVPGAPGAVGASSPDLSSHVEASATMTSDVPSISQSVNSAPVKGVVVSAVSSSVTPQAQSRNQLDDLFLVDGNDDESHSSENEELFRGRGGSGATNTKQRSYNGKHGEAPLSGKQDKDDLMDSLFNAPAGGPLSAAGAAPKADGAKPFQIDSLFETPASSNVAPANAMEEEQQQQQPAASPSSSYVHGSLVPGPQVLPELSNKKDYHHHRQHPRPSPPVPVPPIELPFPYFTGDILRMVCEHMTYRFRISSFGASADGYFRVYPVKTREIPRPLTLPLTEHLDAQDRKFIQGWDELTTVLMVKCASLLNYEELLNLASAKLATYLCERSVEGMRTLLGVDGDFSAQEEAELKKEFQNEGWK